MYQKIAKEKISNGFFDKKGGDLFLKDVRVVVEDIGNRHENSKFGFRIKKELQEDEKEMVKKHVRDSKTR